MFKNNVFKVSVNTKKWFKAATIRAIKTMAQVAVASLTSCVFLGDVNWVALGSTCLLAGITSMLMSIGGIPEVEAEEE